MAGTSVDKVILKGIKFEAVVGLDAWHRPDKTQPVELELHLGPQGGLDAAAREDSVNYTIDYGKLYKSLKAVVFDQKFESVAKLSQAIRASLPEVSSWFISVVLPKAILAANNGIQFSWTDEPEEDSLTSVLQHMKIRDLECRCVIGVNSHERLQKQKLQVTITVWGMENRLSPSLLAAVDMEPSPGLAYQDMVKEVVERVEGSSYETIEALATAIAQTVTMGHGFDNARIDIEKPAGLAGFGSSGVAIGRSRSYFENKDFWKVKRP
ncbi:hypothetical protein LTR24_003152 [Lithohypha guttulata]|uniref:dihydroneopterin aldolase n=1 Tax=Lithohypha guttulata TaxID=1690604 RepID=A0ABR0KH62_9EURO|nr:hypothetical protein LTR24_003152 [Lithohypha guttulata]